MPKMKTRRSAAARFSKTGTGKIKRGRQNLRHILEKKPKSVKKRAASPAYVHEADVRQVKRMLPYL